MGVCLLVLKESNESRFDSYSVRNTVLIISHITFRYCRVHIFSDNLSRKSAMQLSPRNTDTMGAAEWLPVRLAVTPFLALKVIP